MKQSILIGLGGTGSQIVNLIEGRIKKEQLTSEENKVVCVVLDTDQNANENIIASGTDIPVISTCDERTIKEYLSVHDNKNPQRWCPMTRAFGEETMLDGASEVRVKSRIAFMDTVDSSKVHDLTDEIEKVFSSRKGVEDKIRIVIVSSLAGGTGSGMFIQVALWLRKFFKDRAQISIRGVLLLPDIFIKTVENAKHNQRKKLYYYANAYAAIRELNAIDNAIRNSEEAKNEPPIIIDGLFDSHNVDIVSLFDNVFLIDDIDSEGSNLNSLVGYQDMVAQLVYMQLYSPMQSELYSVEDNLYRVLKGKDPVYGSAGASKAIYPTEDVKKYCVLRAMQETLCNSNKGWGRIDETINAEIKEQKEAVKAGRQALEINRAEEYVRLFDEWANRDEDEGGVGEELYRRLLREVNNIEVVGTNGNTGKVVERFSCKIDDFINDIDKLIKEETKGDRNKVRSVVSTIAGPTADSYTDRQISELKQLRSQEEECIRSVIDDFDENYKKIAGALVDRIAPLRADGVSKKNKLTLYSLLLNREMGGGLDNEETIHGVHPVAARYLLYKLALRLNKEIRKTVLIKKETVLAGDDTVSFDIDGTRREETMREYFNQLGLITSTKEVAHFIQCYIDYNEENCRLCQNYEVSILKKTVLQQLLERVKTLIDLLEDMFVTFVKSEASNSMCLIETIKGEIAENIKSNLSNETDGRIAYVYADRACKENMYEGLDLDCAENDGNLNQSILDGVYGSMCVELRPSFECNQPFADKTVAQILYDCLSGSYYARIDASPQMRAKVNLNIIEAIAKESMIKAGPDADPSVRLSNALKKYKRMLTSYAAPFLKAMPSASIATDAEYPGFERDASGEYMVTASGQRLYMESRTHLTFWGMNSEVADANRNLLSSALGINTLTSSDKKGYRENELYCYRSVYAILAGDIEKFNELKPSDKNFYEYYSAVILHMLSRDGNETETPHIDKTWHRVLPYVSSGMRTKVAKEFYMSLWQAIAYKTIVLENGEYRIRSRESGKFGDSYSVTEDLEENGRDIETGEIAKLVRVLKERDKFEFFVKPDLERMFKEDLRLHANNETDFVKNLCKSGDLNPVTMIVRYMNSTEGTSEGFADMVGALTMLLRRVVDAGTQRRTRAAAEKALIKLQYQIYDKCTLAGKKKYFGDWIEVFEKNKLMPKK